MDLAKAKTALANAVAIHRFGLTVKPVEHVAKEESILRRPRDRRKKTRYREGSWVVSMFGGALRVGSQPSRMLHSINDAIRDTLKALFAPVIKDAADRYQEAPSLDNLLALQNVVIWYDEALGMQVGHSDGNLIPCGNGGVARFDKSVFGDRAEECAKYLVQVVNETIDNALTGVSKELREEVLRQVRDE